MSKAIPLRAGTVRLMDMNRVVHMYDVAEWGYELDGQMLSMKVRDGSEVRWPVGNIITFAIEPFNG